MTVTAINSKDEFISIINSGKVVVIDFWAAWCGPCRFISPILEQLSNTYGAVEFYKVDVDARPDISQEVGVRAMPTFLVFRNGEKINELVGADQQGLQSLVTNAVSLA